MPVLSSELVGALDTHVTTTCKLTGRECLGKYLETRSAWRLLYGNFKLSASVYKREPWEWDEGEEEARHTAQRNKQPNAAVTTILSTHTTLGSANH